MRTTTRRAQYSGRVLATATGLVILGGVDAAAQSSVLLFKDGIQTDTAVKARFDSAQGTEAGLISVRPSSETLTRWLRWLRASLPVDRWRDAYLHWQRIAAVVPSVPAPESLVTATGSVLLVWSYGAFHAELELYADGKAHWLVMKGDDQILASSGDEKLARVSAEFYEAMGSGADAWRAGP